MTKVFELVIICSLNWFMNTGIFLLEVREVLLEPFKHICLDCRSVGPEFWTDIAWLGLVKIELVKFQVSKILSQKYPNTPGTFLIFLRQ